MAPGVLHCLCGFPGSCPHLCQSSACWPFLLSFSLSTPAALELRAIDSRCHLPGPSPMFLCSAENSHPHLGHLWNCPSTFTIPPKCHLCDACLEFPISVNTSPVAFHLFSCQSCPYTCQPHPNRLLITHVPTLPHQNFAVFSSFEV